MHSNAYSPALRTMGPLATLLLLCAALFFLPATAQAADLSISSASEWNSFAASVNSGTTYKGDTVSLAADLDGSSLTCVGTAEHPFEGTFDGRKHTISNLSLSGTKYVGLFGVVGASGTLKNVRVTGSVTVNTSSSVIMYVGSLAAVCKGKMMYCSSSCTISIESSMTGTDAYEENGGIVAEEIGGLVGMCYGNMTYCKFTGSLSAQFTGAPYSSTIACCVGGVVGMFGGEISNSRAYYNSACELDGTPATLSYCYNKGAISLVSTGVYSYTTADGVASSANATVQAVGGVCGYSLGNIYDCTNAAEVSTWTGEYSDVTSSGSSTERPDGQGSARVACGDEVAGVVGALRGSVSCGGSSSGDLGTKDEIRLLLYNCTNKGEVIALHGGGGICGAAGTFTTIMACVNEGNISVTRWNKPMGGGIVAQSYDTVCYCLNKGEVMTETGAGYYVAGIAGTMYSQGSSNAPTPELYSCLNVGKIWVSSTGYRAGGIVGGNEGYVHQVIATSESITKCNATIGKEEGDIESIDYSSPSVAYIMQKYNTSTKRANRAINILNFCANEDGYGVYWVVDTDVDSECLTLNIRSSATATDLSGATVTGCASFAVSTATFKATGSLATSSLGTYAAYAPMPLIHYVTVSLNGSTLTLYQNADFKVNVSEYAEGTYTCTLEGIGDYSGVLDYSYTYTISSTTVARDARSTATLDLSDAAAYLDEDYASEGVWEESAHEHSYTSVVTLEATCTATGVRTYTCSGCGDTYTEDIEMVSHTAGAAATCTSAQTCTVCGAVLAAALGHTTVVDEAVAATCTSTGLTEGSHCSVCSEIIVAQTVVAMLEHTAGAAATCISAQTCTVCGVTLAAALGHSYVNGVCTVCGNDDPDHVHVYSCEVTTSATCTTTGLLTYTCVCGATYTELVSALGHSSEEVAAVAATCTTDGCTAGAKCSVCGEILSGCEVVPAAHTVVEIEALEATCETTGITAGTMCSVCYEILSGCEIVPYAHISVDVEAVAATCTEVGFTAGTKCSLCNVVLSGWEVVPAVGHTSVAVEAVAATCTTDGCTAGTKCSVCNTVLSGCTTIAALGHSYTGVVTKSATCTEKGVTTYTCARCSDTYTEDIALATHTSVDVAAVAATCTAAGCTAGTKCSVCGEILSGCEATAQLTHSYASVVTKAASCTEAGVVTYTCSLCGDSYTVAEEAEGHVFADGACTVCGEADPDYTAPVTTIAQTIKASKTSVKIKAKKGKKATITIKNAKTALAIKSLSGAAKKALGVKVSGKKVTITATAKAKKGKSYTIKVYAKAKGSYAKSNVVKIKVAFK